MKLLVADVISEETRMAVIENIIAQVIAREEAERKAAEEAERETNRLQMREEAESQLPATSIISKPGQGNTTTPQTTQPAIGGKQEKQSSNVCGDVENWKTTGEGKIRLWLHWTILKK